MTTTHHDSATTWCDLADALTPQQIAYLENWESQPDIPPNADGSSCAPEQHQSTLLFTAREFVEQNLAGALFADVPPPPEDGRHWPWEHVGDGVWQRCFVGTVRKVGGLEIAITGVQSTDGLIVRSIRVDDTDDIDATAARQIAAALIEAVNELEGLQ